MLNPSPTRAWLLLLIAFAVPLLLLQFTWETLYLPGLKRLQEFQIENKKLSANVYEKSWLDSTAMALQKDTTRLGLFLQKTSARCLPSGPLQPLLDGLRQAASLQGVDILENQSSTVKTDSLQEIRIHLRAMGAFAAHWNWLHTLENRQPWWRVEEFSLRPSSEKAALIEGQFHLTAFACAEVN